MNHTIDIATRFKVARLQRLAAEAHEMVDYYKRRGNLCGMTFNQQCAAELSSEARKLMGVA